MSGAIHEPDPRVERLVEQARYWQGMHTIDIPTDELRGLLVSAFEAGQREPSPEQAEALAAAQERAQRAEDRVRELLRTNGELALFLLGTGSEGAAAMCRERRRQVDVEGYTAEHDAGIPADQLIHAGVAYAMAAVTFRPGDAWLYWPWDQDGFKPAGPHRNLARAGAIAEKLFPQWDQGKPLPHATVLRDLGVDVADEPEP